MLQCNGEKIQIGHFPDGTLLMKEKAPTGKAVIQWLFENNEELVALHFFVQHLREKGIEEIELQMPYIPNARQDRVKGEEDIFTLKYFAEVINSLGFDKIYVLDPHSSVSEALFDNLAVESPKRYIKKVIDASVLNI